MSKHFTLQEIADAVAGRLIGAGDVVVTRLAHPADLRGGDLALATDAKLLPLLEQNKNTPAIVAGAEEDSAFLSHRIIVARPRLALAKLTALFADPVTVTPGIHPTAIIEDGARIGAQPRVGALVYIGAHAVIGDNATLHPQCYIGENATIGDDALIYSGVRIGNGTRIGDRVILHFNSSIGADGFSFVTPQIGSVEQAKSGKGGAITAANTALIRIASLAPVTIGDDVEIGANSSVDRGTLRSTSIGKGTKIDNQVQIGHNVTIGENCMICGRVGIAGSAVIGDRVVLGGATGVADHVAIGDDAVAMGMSGIAGNIAARSVVGGIPAMPRDKLMENIFIQGRLKQTMNKIKELSDKIAALEKKAQND